MSDYTGILTLAPRHLVIPSSCHASSLVTYSWLTAHKLGDQAAPGSLTVAALSPYHFPCFGLKAEITRVCYRA